MKSTLTLLVIWMLSVTLSTAGVPAYVVTYSPDNPVVGELVTFTLSQVNGACNYALDPDRDDAEGFIPISTQQVATFAYPAAGTFTVELDEDCSVGQERNAGSTLVGNGFWVLRNSTTVSANKTITVTAAPSSSIPTLSEWGLIILFLSLMTFGIIAVRQRQMEVHPS